MWLHTIPTHAQTFPLSLHIHNNDATDFIPFCTRTYSPIVLAYIITNINVPYFSNSYIMFFLYFLNTNNVSGYIITPIITEEFCDHHLCSCTLTAVLCNTLQHILHFTQPPPTCMQTSFRKSLLQNEVPPFVQSNVHLTSYFCIS